MRPCHARPPSSARRLQRSVAERKCRVELTASFLERLESIEVFLASSDAAAAYDALLAELRATVIPNLQRFPNVGRRYLDLLPQSAEALNQLGALPAGAAHDIREYLHGDYLILYTVSSPATVVHLLSIRHHRELSFQFVRLWPSSGTSQER